MSRDTVQHYPRAPRRPLPVFYALALLTVVLAGGAAPRSLRGQFGGFDDTARLTANAVIDRATVSPGGEAVIAVVVDVEKGWHIQSAKPLHPSFIPTTLAPTAPPDVTIGAVRFPVGKNVPVPASAGVGPEASVYTGRVILLVPVRVAAGAAPGPRKVALKLRTQACSDETNSCLRPTVTPLSVTLAVAAPQAVPAPAAHEDVFAAAGRQTFYPDAPASQAVGPATGGGPGSASAPAPTSANTPPARRAASALPGVDVTLLSDQDQLDRLEKTPFTAARRQEDPLWWIIVSALIAGVILNVMPCVLPVIPLKVLGLVDQAHGDRRAALAHAGAFAVGMILLFVGLGAVLSGFGLFYGQQFQSVAFVLTMAYLVLALALSMMGVWTINTPRAVYAVDRPRAGYAGSFMNGLLATLLATPCSGPFLGTVLAWALVQPAWVTMLMLALVGVGMAAPYVLLAAFPGALKRIPTAGRWSELLKQFLGLVMVGVSVFLITRLANVNYWPWALYGAVLVAVACWAWGQAPAPAAEPGRLWAVRLSVLAVGAAAGVGLYALAAHSIVPETRAAGEDVVRLPDRSDGRTWLPFNLALVHEAVRQRRPVVIDWTANWCINCKTVEALVLDAAPVQDAFAKTNAVLLRADLTADNPPADKLKRQLGGLAIPFLAVVSPAAPTEAAVFRDFYSADAVTRAVNAAAPR